MNDSSAISKKSTTVFTILILVICNISLQAQPTKNSDEQFFKFESIKKDLDCSELDRNVSDEKATKIDPLLYYASLIRHAECLMQEQKIDKSESVFNQAIEDAKKQGYYQIGRNALEGLTQLVSYYKPDEIVSQSLRKVRYDSLYSSKKQELVSRAELVFTYHYLNQMRNTLYQSEIIIKEAVDDESLSNGCLGKALALTNSDPIAADSFFRQSLALSVVKDSFRRASAHKEYGEFLLSQGHKIKAIDHLIEGINLTPKSSKYDLSRTSSLNTLSQLFFGLKQFDRSRQYIEQSIAICEKNKYKSRNAVTAMVNAQLLRQEGKMEEALSEINNSKQYFYARKDLKGVLSNLALETDIVLSQKDKEQSLFLNQKMDSILALNLSFDIPIQVFGAKAALAMQYGSDLQKKEALNEYYAASNQENDPVGKYFSLDNLYQLAKQNGNYKLALDYLEKHKAIASDMFESEQTLMVNKMESDYNRKGQDLKIASLDQENMLKAKTVSVQKKAIIGSGIGLGLLAILSFFLFRINKKVNSQKAIIEKALQEKDILLREIHHRVKNNLQLVSSLLTIQSRDVKDEQALEALHVGKSRVKSMSLIHQDLYQKDKLTGINVKNYLEKLSTELFQTYNISSDQINLHLDIEDIDLDVDTIVPLGLIINELITNSLKYAFPDGRSGNVFIEFKMIDRALKLGVKDDGVGLAGAISSDTSFGNTLVKALTKQLSGTLQVIDAKGTQVELLFLDYKLAA